MVGILRADYLPFAVLVMSVVMVVLLITRWRFHPFIALMLSAIFVGLVSPELPVKPGQPALIAAVELPMLEFGIMAGKIAWVIALAAIIGTAMMESGAAEKIVNFLLDSLGEKRAAIALIISGFILSIPVFFDTVFFLLIPLGITLALKTGRDFVLYVLAIGGGAAITHTLVPPTPGPLLVAETLSLNLGTVILMGLAAGVLPAVVVYWVAHWFNKRVTIPVRVVSHRVIEIPDPPSLLSSVMPVAVPLVLISLDSIVAVLNHSVPEWIAFLGNKNIAMAAGAFLALVTWGRARKLKSTALWDAVGSPLQIAGAIILITSAGGAYGAMIQHSGIGPAIRLATEGSDVHYILLAWVIAAVMKTAQGSGTVAMVTTSAIMAALLGSGFVLPYHPVYIFLAIGFGSLFIPWMNDSGFWVVAKMSGFTEKEALGTWTVMLAIMSVTGLCEVLMLAWIFPAEL